MPDNSLPRSARPAGRADAPLSARLSLLLQPARARPRADELDTATWARVFREAAALGVLQVHLSGGEPAARRDLADIVKAAREAGLYTNLITSAVGLTPQTMAALADAGLDHVQISIQDSEQNPPTTSPAIDGASARKRALAAEVVKLGLPLTVNMVVHRANIGRIERDGRAGARRSAPRGSRSRMCNITAGR